MIYLKNSGIEIYNKGACSKTLYFLAAERVEPPVPDGCCVVMIYPYEWTEMMTPWQHSGKGMGKTGGGAEFSQEFVPNLLTYVENGLEDKVAKRGIAGYSLGGLEAFYMACVEGIFDFAGSVSGSFWYPGAVEYFEKILCLKGCGTYICLWARGKSAQKIPNAGRCAGIPTR